jgi:hypothetical protein
MNAPDAIRGKLAIPAAMAHVRPDWINPKTKWLNRRGIPSMLTSTSDDRSPKARGMPTCGVATAILFLGQPWLENPVHHPRLHAEPSAKLEDAVASGLQFANARLYGGLTGRRPSSSSFALASTSPALPLSRMMPARKKLPSSGCKRASDLRPDAV